MLEIVHHKCLLGFFFLEQARSKKIGVSMLRCLSTQIPLLWFKGHVAQFRNFGTLITFWTNRAIRFKFGTEMEDGPSLRRQWTISKWARLRSRDPVSKLWDPLITFELTALRFKYGMQIKDTPCPYGPLSWVGGIWLIFAWHLQNSKRKSQQIFNKNNSKVYSDV